MEVGRECVRWLCEVCRLPHGLVEFVRCFNLKCQVDGGKIQCVNLGIQKHMQKGLSLVEKVPSRR